MIDLTQFEEQRAAQVAEMRTRLRDDLEIDGARWDETTGRQVGVLTALLMKAEFYTDVIRLREITTKARLVSEALALDD